VESSVNTELYIPIPVGFFGYKYGVHSTRHASAERIIIRITKADRQLLKRGAELLDMREAQFIREIAITAAKALIQRAEEHDYPGDRSG
jgi:hypothetical protein